MRAKGRGVLWRAGRVAVEGVGRGAGRWARGLGGEKREARPAPDPALQFFSLNGSDWRGTRALSR